MGRGRFHSVEKDYLFKFDALNLFTLWLVLVLKKFSAIAATHSAAPRAWQHFNSAYSHTHTQTRTHTHWHMHAHAPALTHINIHTYKRMHVSFAYTNIHIHTQTHVYPVNTISSNKRGTWAAEIHSGDGERRTVGSKGHAHC